METVSEGVEFHLFKAFCHKAFFATKFRNIKSPDVSKQCLKTQNCSHMEVYHKAGLRLLSIRRRIQALLGMSCLS